MPGPVIGLIVLAVIVVIVGGTVLAGRRQREVEAVYQQVCRDQGWAPVEAPLGMSDAWLTQHHLLPGGDRDCSAVWGMQGSAEVTFDGAAASCDMAVFEWWWEDRQTSTDSKGHTRTTWVRRSSTAALLRLPSPLAMPEVRVTGEGLFTRMGIGGRSDFQLESEEFNKRYDVRVADRQAAIRLFDADFQAQMLGRFVGTTFELRHDLVLVVVPAPGGKYMLGGEGRRGGATGLAALFSRQGDRIRTDPGLVRSLPGVGHRALALVQAMPEGWWRAANQGRHG